MSFCTIHKMEALNLNRVGHPSNLNGSSCSSDSLYLFQFHTILNPDSNERQGKKKKKIMIEIRALTRLLCG